MRISSLIRRRRAELVDVDEDPAAAAPPPHIGVHFRIRCPAGVLLDVDSDHLYYIAKFGGGAEPCTLECLPGCITHGWHEVFPGEIWPGEKMTYNGTRDLIIEVRPVHLREMP